MIQHDLLCTAAAIAETSLRSLPDCLDPERADTSKISSCHALIQQEQTILALIACMWTALQTAHCSLSTIFFVVLAFLWNTGFV